MYAACKCTMNSKIYIYIYYIEPMVLQHIYAVILHALYVIKQLLETMSNFFNLYIDLLDYSYLFVYFDLIILCQSQYCTDCTIR